jgi:hypothetical protein
MTGDKRFAPSDGMPDMLVDPSGLDRTAVLKSLNCHVADELAARNM